MKKKRCNSSSERGLAIGLAIGVGIGFVLDNLVVGIGIGTALGLTVFKDQGKGTNSCAKETEAPSVEGSNRE
jgi:hypothetical protein